MFLNFARRCCLGVALGVVVSLACGADDAVHQCYEQATLPEYDFDTKTIRVCDVALPIPRRYPEFEDTELVHLALPREGDCPTCPEELDALFWQAFLDELEDRGLEEGEDPDCVNQGYAIEIACLSRMQSSDTCRYRAIVASHCALGPNYTPVRPSP